jgi:hypothetical protein
MTDQRLTLEELTAIRERLEGERPGPGISQLHCTCTMCDRYKLLAEIDRLRGELHQLKRALSPSRAGAEPWDGMPSLDYFVRVAERMREREPRVDAACTPTKSAP